MLELLLLAQLTTWYWEDIGRAYIGDPNSFEAQLIVDDIATPATVVECNDLVCDIEFGVEGKALLAVTGRHSIRLAVRSPGIELWSISDAQLTIITGCPYLKPVVGAKPEIRPVGNGFTGRIAFNKAPGDGYGKARKEALENDGWWVQRTDRTTVDMGVDLVCLGKGLTDD